MDIQSLSQQESASVQTVTQSICQEEKQTSFKVVLACVLEHTKPYSCTQVSDKTYQAHALMRTLRKQTNPQHAPTQEAKQTRQAFIHPYMNHSLGAEVTWHGKDLEKQSQSQGDSKKKKKKITANYLVPLQPN